jgi:Ser/Thr protein kinase RdoA (MazF antagonist)
MSLRGQALLAFDLPAAPTRVDELPPPCVGSDVCRVHAPAGRFLLLCSDGALGMAFEATLFDLLAESRYPAPRPRRARGGSMIARLSRPDGGAAAAACYAWPPGDALDPASASVPQLLEIGRLLARLHQLAETHPASVADERSGAALLALVPASADRDALGAVLSTGLPALPSGAVHGGLRPSFALFVGDRVSAVLPSGLACSGALVLDLAETAVAWLAGAQRAAAALRGIVSGYQALRRLSPEEKDALFPALRHAAAREGARRILVGREQALAPLKAVDALGDADVRAAAGT